MELHERVMLLKRRRPVDWRETAEIAVEGLAAGMGIGGGHTSIVRRYLPDPWRTEEIIGSGAAPTGAVSFSLSNILAKKVRNFRQNGKNE